MVIMSVDPTGGGSWFSKSRRVSNLHKESSKGCFENRFHKMRHGLLFFAIVAHSGSTLTRTANNTCGCAATRHQMPQRPVLCLIEESICWFKKHHAGVFRSCDPN